MSGFGARSSEVLSQVDKISKDLQGGEEDRIRAALKNYLSTRDDALNALVDVLSNDWDDPKRSEYEDKLNADGLALRRL